MLESSPSKPSAFGLTDLSVCCCRAGLGLGTSTRSLPQMLFSLPCTDTSRKNPDHQRSKSKVKARVGSMPRQGGYLGHHMDFKGVMVAYSYSILSDEICLPMLVWMLLLPPRRNAHPFVVHGYTHHSTL